jgi:hypothetical protein
MAEKKKAAEKKRNRRPNLRGCLVYWDDDKKRFRMTTPKTGKAARGMGGIEAIFLLTEKIEKRDLKDIELFQASMAEAEIGMLCTMRGRVTFEELQEIAAA